MMVYRNLSVQFSLPEVASGSLKVGGLSTPLLEYSLHLLAASAALLALSLTSSSATTHLKLHQYLEEAEQAKHRFTAEATHEVMQMYRHT